MKKQFLAVFIMAAALFISENAARADGEIKIGWIGPLTGDTAVVGVDSAEVAKQVFGEINDKGGIKKQKIKLILEDDQYFAAKTLSSYNRLVHMEGAKIIFVLTYGGMIAAAPQAEKDNVILINPLDCDEELAALPRNSFCIAKKTEDLGVMNAKHALTHGNVPAAIIYFNGDPFMPKVAKATLDTFRTSGAEVVLFEGATEKTDLKALLSLVKQKKARSLFFYGNDYFGIGMKQARQLGVDAKFYALTNTNSPGFQTAAGDTVNGTYTAGWFAPRTERYSTFLENYKAKIGRAPLLAVATVPTYDMANLLTIGLEKTVDEKSGEYSVDDLRAYLYGIKSYSGLSGDITMDSDGAVRSFTVGMYSFDHGSFNKED